MTEFLKCIKQLGDSDKIIITVKTEVDLSSSEFTLKIVYSEKDLSIPDQFFNLTIKSEKNYDSTYQNTITVNNTIVGIIFFINVYNSENKLKYTTHFLCAYDKNRVVALGNSHGDKDSLISTLKYYKIINDQNNEMWGEEKNWLIILMGGILTRGIGRGRDYINYVNKLNNEAHKKNSHILTLIGKEEIEYSMQQRSQEKMIDYRLMVVAIGGFIYSSECFTLDSYVILNKSLEVCKQNETLMKNLDSYLKKKDVFEENFKKDTKKIDEQKEAIEEFAEKYNKLGMVFGRHFNYLNYTKDKKYITFYGIGNSNFKSKICIHLMNLNNILFIVREKNTDINRINLILDEKIYLNDSIQIVSKNEAATSVSLAFISCVDLDLIKTHSIEFVTLEKEQSGIKFKYSWSKEYTGFNWYIKLYIDASINGVIFYIKIKDPKGKDIYKSECLCAHDPKKLYAIGDVNMNQFLNVLEKSGVIDNMNDENWIGENMTVIFLGNKLNKTAPEDLGTFIDMIHRLNEKAVVKKSHIIPLIGDLELDTFLKYKLDESLKDSQPSIYNFLSTQFTCVLIGGVLFSNGSFKPDYYRLINIKLGILSNIPNFKDPKKIIENSPIKSEVIEFSLMVNKFKKENKDLLEIAELRKIFCMVSTSNMRLSALDNYVLTIKINLDGLYLHLFAIKNEKPKLNYYQSNALETFDMAPIIIYY